MSFMDPYKDLNPQVNMTKSTYVGIVEDNNDPDKLQRVRIRVRELHGDIPTEKLPWAIAEVSTVRNLNKNGSFSVPPLGQLVQVTLDNEDVYSPRYKSLSLYQALSEFSEEYLTSYGVQDEYGNVMKIGESGITIKETSGVTIVIADGTTTIISPTSCTIESPKITLDGDLKVTGTTDLVGDTTASNIVATSVIASGKVLETHTHTSAVPGTETSTPN